WRRHGSWGFVAGKAEPGALVAGALFSGWFALGRGTADTLFDVARLFAHLANDATSVGVKNAIAIHVTDAADGIADTLFKIELGVTGDFAREDNEVAFGERLAGDTAQRVLCEPGVQHVIADGIANFIGMTFGDRFGGKDVAVRHG